MDNPVTDVTRLIVLPWLCGSLRRVFAQKLWTVLNTVVVVS